MSDFLHNLRTGNMKRFDRPRKNFDNPQYRNQNDRHYNKDRKGGYQKKYTPATSYRRSKSNLR